MKEEKDQKILIVDDSAMNRALLSDMLSSRYEILEAADGKQGIQLIQKYETQISLVLLDVVMPVLDGFEVLALMNRYHWIEEIPVIMISSENSHSVIERAYELGASDYINRPFDEVIVLRRVINTIMLYSKQKHLVSMVADQVYELEKNNTLMVSILSHIVEFRNGESGLHVLHIGILTEMILKRLIEKTNRYSLSLKDISLIAKASTFHDIGKIGIDESILNKPGRLGQEEFEMMKTHSMIGAKMLNDLPIYKEDELVKVAYEICRWHHERFDGRGYPDGLQGDAIPISAQAVSIADAYDALISERVYKKAFSHEKAIQMILDGECGTFNPILLECLSEIQDELQKELKICSYGYSHKKELDAITERLINHKNMIQSSRTLNLLEQERIRFQFFTSVSTEIQFEYTCMPNMLTLSEWGAQRLQLPSVILNVSLDPSIKEICRWEDLKHLDHLLKTTDPKDPIIEFDTQIKIDGQWVDKTLICQAMWTQDQEPKYTGMIGKIVDPNMEIKELYRFKKSSKYDVLTNLLNQTQAKIEISGLLQSYVNRDFVMILIDLQYFKKVNHDRGHVFGDRILKYIAEKLRQNTKDRDDVIARVGGDEFLVFMKENQEISNTIQNIFSSIQGDLDGFQIMINMGIVSTIQVERDFDRLIRCADLALFDAKKKENKGFSYYEETMEDHEFSSISCIDHM